MHLAPRQKWPSKSANKYANEDGKKDSPLRGVMRRPVKKHFEFGVRLDGPHTRFKDHQHGPNTRSKSRSNISIRHRLLCNLCWNSANTVLEKGVKHKVKRFIKRSTPKPVFGRDGAGPVGMEPQLDSVIHHENAPIQELPQENGSNEPPVGESEQSSCQRSRVYFKQMYWSCARTYRPWPFPKSSMTASAGSEVHPAGLFNGDGESPIELSPSINDGAASPLCSNPDHEEEVGTSLSRMALVTDKGLLLSPSINDGAASPLCSNPDHEEEVGTSLSRMALITDKGLLPSPSINDGAATPLCSNPDHEEGEVGTSLSRMALITNDSKVEVIDEITAYEQDILLVDAVHDDLDLLDNVPEESILKLGFTSTKPNITTCGRVLSNADGAALEAKERMIPVPRYFSGNSQLTGHEEEGNDGGPWGAHCRNTPSPTQSDGWPPAEQKSGQQQHQEDANNNRTTNTSDWIQTIQENNFLWTGTTDLGKGMSKKKSAGDSRQRKFNSYCRFYFSETLTCSFKVCRFQHAPVEGDEKLRSRKFELVIQNISKKEQYYQDAVMIFKFCMETVIRFSKNLLCLQKASAVFTDYYQKNSPGVSFSQHALTSLLRALLNAGFVTDVLCVLNASFVHKIMPGPEFLLELFNLVRKRGLTAIVPELLRLTAQMESSGLVLGFDPAECLRSGADFHGNPGVTTAGSHTLSPSSSTGFPECLSMARATLDVERCAKLRDWQQLGPVFRSVCQSSQRPSDLHVIASRIATALLADTKNKLPLPFATFADAVCQGRVDDLTKTFLGRIGVSLMLRYHKTHQWAKGRQVVEILSRVQVSYSMLKGLFGNEKDSSRCCLVTMATELFLLSGSIEGALNALRDDKWFLGSGSWPCEASDLEKRTHVLKRLAEKTSHRDTLEILSNLPGLNEPNDFVDVSKYSAMFNTHLQVCVEKQILPVASDLVDLMFCKKLDVESSLLQALVNKLGKQKFWPRAREVFKRALKAGYYPDVAAPPGLLALSVPSSLGEMELVLCFEMFITVNAALTLALADTTSILCVVLKRSQTCEQEYLSASNRLLSAAGLLQPKLAIRFTAVNCDQEQMFTLDTPPVRLWIRHNLSWANELWTESS